jgi:putative ABC transport system permease protein
MMTELRKLNRAMFWRILRRLLSANRGRLFVMLLALGAGAAVTAALLNLQVDAKRRLTTEFRAFGANVIITPRQSAAVSGNTETLDASLFELVPKKNGTELVAKAAFLPEVATIFPWDEHRGVADSTGALTAMVVGYEYYAGDLYDVIPGTTLERLPGVSYDGSYCEAGKIAAEHLHVKAGNFIRVGETEEGICQVTRVDIFGGAEDNQIFVSIAMVQRLTGLAGRASSIEVSVPGTPQQIEDFIETLQKQIPTADVRPIRQFTEGEAKIYNRISGLLTATVGIVLLLTALCVMAAMTNVAIERKMDVGLMKAIGGATRRVVRLFLAEAALLGLAGGLIGAAVGLVLSIGLGKAVFGMAARPRLIVYPLTVGLTMLVAILSAVPLRRLASIRPASVFRGEA